MIFEEQLTQLERKILATRWKTLLFTDQHCSHEEYYIALEHKGSFFPAHCTSSLQPLDPEIKHTFKYNYRKQFIQKTAAMKHGRQQQDASCLKFMYCVQKPGSWKLQLSTTALQSVVLWSSRINNDNNALKLIEDEENDWHSL